MVSFQQKSFAVKIYQNFYGNILANPIRAIHCRIIFQSNYCMIDLFCVINFQIFLLVKEKKRRLTSSELNFYIWIYQVKSVQYWNVNLLDIENIRFVYLKEKRPSRKICLKHSSESFLLWEGLRFDSKEFKKNRKLEEGFVNYRDLKSRLKTVKCLNKLFPKTSELKVFPCIGCTNHPEFLEKKIGESLDVIRTTFTQYLDNI